MIRCCASASDKNKLMVNKFSKLIIRRIFQDLVIASSTSTANTSYLAWLILWQKIHGDQSSTAGVLEYLYEEYGTDLKESDGDGKKLIFAIETYFALTLQIYAQTIFLKALSRVDESFLLQRNNVVDLLKTNYCKVIFNNTLDLGVYAWFLETLDDSFQRLLEAYEEECEQNHCLEISLDKGDFLGRTYQSLFPKKIRHSIGAYFTPEWLAELMFQESLDGKDLSAMRIIEPTCGSGVFTICLAKYLKNRIDASCISSCEAIQYLSSNFVGLEKNPISVFTSKVNFIRAVLSILDRPEQLKKKIPVPIHFADCIDELHYAQLIGGSLVPVSVAENTFNIPKVVAEHHLDVFKDTLLRSIEDNEGYEQFQRWISRLSIPESGIPELYRFMEQKHKCSSSIYSWYREYFLSIHSSKFKNSFDLVIGNPPWVNWETLSSTYRRRIQPIWPLLGIFSPVKSEKSFSKEDLCTFITYAVTDLYLKKGGSLAFVLPQGVFQSSINSKGFRKFLIAYNNTHLKVEKVQDFTNLNVFSGSSSRTAVLYLTKGKKTSYPIRYEVWKDSNKRKNQHLWLSEKHPSLSSELNEATPVVSSVEDGSWKYSPPEVSFHRIEGAAAYRARAGMFTGGANAVFYLKLSSYSAGIYSAENVTERVKRQFAKSEFELEEDFVYPFIRGRDVESWEVSYDESRAVLLPHTSLTKMAPVEEEILRVQAPRTHNYLVKAKEFLSGRGGLTAMDRANAEKGFYNVLRIGEYTFADYKVAWRYIHKEFTCAVLEPIQMPNGKTKPCIPQEKLMIIPFQNREEAFFVCGILSSSQFKKAVESRMVNTQISAHVIQNLAIPKFDDQNIYHIEIARICEQGHKEVFSGQSSNIADYKARITSIVDILFP